MNESDTTRIAEAITACVGFICVLLGWVAWLKWGRR